MSRMPEVAPTEQRRGEETITKHPAFGQIAVSRITGLRTLYGSDFVHQNYVNVSIYPSDLHRTNNHDWAMHGVRPLISIDMSEAQWGSFVSSFGVGEGTQCTLTSVAEKRMPGLPHEDRSRLYQREADEAARAVASDLEALRVKIEAGTTGLSKARQSEMLADVGMAIRRLSDTLPFVASSFAEHMERTAEKAKSEVHAYVTNTIMRAGLSAIEGGAPLALPGPTAPPHPQEIRQGDESR